MREIKFRGQTYDTPPHWVFGDLYHYTTGEPAINYTNPHKKWLESEPVRPDTVGQFTGLYDTDGLEIYEGDIVKATLKEPSFVKRFKLQNEIVGEMLFDNAWWIKERETVNLIPPWRLRYYDLTVIGNVHDSPELLEEKDA